MSEILEVKNVTKIFGPNKSEALKLMNKGLSKDEILKVTGATVALNNVSFKVKTGEIFVIIGLSGSGKSTIVRCLNMLQAPTSGEVFYNGINLTKLKKEAKFRNLDERIRQWSFRVSACFRIGMF